VIIDGINIIAGENNTGRTNLLFGLSNILKSKICFIVGYDNKYYLRYPKFEYTFSDVSDIRTFQLISQISDRYDYLIIDDIDRIKKEYISILFKINKPIIFTCLSGTISDTTTSCHDYKKMISKSYQLICLGLDGNIVSIDNDRTKIKISDFLKNIDRDNKIKSILK
jgi:hypothetical protein